MALDVYVMPLLRFKRGEFTTGVERATGVKATTVAATGQVYERRVADAKARREVHAIEEAVRRANPGVQISWCEEGDVFFAEQVWWTFAGLRAYARWVDLQGEIPAFDAPPGGDWYKHPVMRWEGEKTWTFPAILDHSLFAGYLLPCDFAKSVEVEPWTIRSWKFSKGVGSAPRVLADTEGLAELLGVEEKQPASGNFMDEVRIDAWMLRKALRLACAQGLPVIFCG